MVWENDARTLALTLRSPTKLRPLYLRCSIALDETPRRVGRTLSSVQLLTRSKIGFRADEVLRRRLKMRTDAQGF